MRYVVEISYVASDKFCGWQIQKNKPTYEGELERVFSSVLKTPISLVASGRTDAGVSAIKQVAHFDYEGEIERGFVGHVNSLLSTEIRVLSLQKISEDFHARFSAKQKTYKYCFYVSKQAIPYFDAFASQVKWELNDSVMYAQIKQLLGTQDFSSFCASGSEVKDKVRTIYYANLEKSGNLYTFTITGNGFLYNMVRIIVGTLIDIARGYITLNIADIIKKQNRDFAGKTASAKGLVLAEVEYN